MKLSRRSLIRAGALALTAPPLSTLEGLGPLQAGAADAQRRNWKHGLSLFGDLKYPAGFKHFDYVNPNAPRGGVVRQIAIGTFDNFNMVVAGVKGQLAAGISCIYDTLMTPSLDEVSTEYGLLAEAVSHPADFSSRHLSPARRRRKWHDGKPVTPEDVIFSFEAFKKYHPQYSAYYRHVTKAEKTGERDVTFTFDQAGQSRIAADRRPDQRAAEALVGRQGRAGPPARRLADHARAAARLRRLSDQGLRAGPHRSSTSASPITGARTSTSMSAPTISTNCASNISATPPSRSKPSRPTSSTGATRTSAKDWATAYDFPAVTQKRVMLEEFPIRNFGVMQAFAFNTRRDKFKDARVRRAFNFAFDFEEMNKQIFFGQYTRINSYFQGTELASSGLPKGRELEILNTVKDKVPPEVFTTAYTNPVGGNRRGGAQQSARGAAAVPRGRLGDQGPEADQRQDRRADDGRGPVMQPTFERIVQLLEAAPGTGRRRRLDPRRRCDANTRTGCAAGTST